MGGRSRREQELSLGRHRIVIDGDLDGLDVVIGLHGMVDTHPDGHGGRLLGQDRDLEVDPMLAIGPALGASEAGRREDGHQAPRHTPEERTSPNPFDRGDLCPSAIH